MLSVLNDGVCSCCGSEQFIETFDSRHYFFIPKQTFFPLLFRSPHWVNNNRVWANAALIVYCANKTSRKHNNCALCTVEAQRLRERRMTMGRIILSTAKDDCRCNAEDDDDQSTLQFSLCIKQTTGRLSNLIHSCSVSLRRLIRFVYMLLCLQLGRTAISQCNDDFAKPSICSAKQSERERENFIFELRWQKPIDWISV